MKTTVVVIELRTNRMTARAEAADQCAQNKTTISWFFVLPAHAIRMTTTTAAAAVGPTTQVWWSNIRYRRRRRRWMYLCNARVCCSGTIRDWWICLWSSNCGATAYRSHPPSGKELLDGLRLVVRTGRWRSSDRRRCHHCPGRRRFHRWPSSHYCRCRCRCRRCSGWPPPLLLLTTRSLYTVHSRSEIWCIYIYVYIYVHRN